MLHKFRQICSREDVKKVVISMLLKVPRKINILAEKSVRKLLIFALLMTPKFLTIPQFKCIENSQNMIRATA